ncbi:TrmH family RNA methyltransferase [Chryseobacterium sp. A301]
MEKLQRSFDYLKEFLTPARLEKIEHYSKESSDFILPVVQDVYQFRNAAAIVRSVEACGFHKIVALEERNEFNPNLTVTKGAETWVEVEKMKADLSSLQEIKDRGYELVAVSLENNAVELPDFEITAPVALLFGTELKGVSKEALALSDRTLSIPMFGFTKSYNVSVAAGICLYELKQKLLRSNLPTTLSQEKQLELKIRWAINTIPSGKEIYQQYLKKYS